MGRPRPRIKKIPFSAPSKCPIDLFRPLANRTTLKRLHARSDFALASVLHAASSLGPGKSANLDVFCTVPCDICRQTSCAKACFKPALAELDTARVQYMAVRTRSGRRSGATPLNGGADNLPYEWKIDALLTVFYLAVLYYWR